MDGRRYIGRGGVRVSSWLPIGPDQSPRRRRWTGADGPNRRPRQRFRRAIDHCSCSVMTGGPRLRELTSHPAAGGKFESEVPLRDFAGYPGAAPTGQLWSIVDKTPLPVDVWPTGGRASQVFNPDWSQQFGGAFYFPFDRRALDGHPAWANDHTGHVWGVDKTVVDVLHLLREILRTASGPSMKATGDEATS
jgi:hypothetical protein